MNCSYFISYFNKLHGQYANLLHCILSQLFKYFILLIMVHVYGIFLQTGLKYYNMKYRREKNMYFI